MPRRLRAGTGGQVFHVLNRAAGRMTLFDTDNDYSAFLRVLEAARERVPMRLLGYCLMPNHWHLVLWPRNDDDLSAYMQWLTVTHTVRWHSFHGSAGTGPVYQGRFKSFPVQCDDHFYRVCRYVERNALRANLVMRAERWRWSSLWQQVENSWSVSLDTWPLPRPGNWVQYVNEPETKAELEALRTSVKRGSPFGAIVWRDEVAATLGVEHTVRSFGRPRNKDK